MMNNGKKNDSTGTPANGYMPRNPIIPGNSIPYNNIYKFINECIYELP